MPLGLPKMVAGAGLWNGGLGAAPPAPISTSGMTLDNLASLFPPPEPPSYPDALPVSEAGLIPGYNAPWRSDPTDLSMDVRNYRDPVTGYIHYENSMDPTPPPAGWTPGTNTGGTGFFGSNPTFNSALSSPNPALPIGSPLRRPSPVMQGLEMLPDGRYWRPEGPGDVPSSGNMVDAGPIMGGFKPLTPPPSAPPQPNFGVPQPMPGSFPMGHMPAPGGEYFNETNRPRQQRRPISWEYDIAGG